MSEIKGSSEIICHESESRQVTTASSRRVAFLLLVALSLVLPGIGFAQPRPTWVSATRLTTGDGFATLRWSVEGDERVALFRISEDYSGERQISFTDQAEIRVFRSEPGEYSFWVQACKRYSDGYPQCGELSQRLTLGVMARLTKLSSLPAATNKTSTVTDQDGVNSNGKFTGCRLTACN